jgi:MFS family permease
LLLFLRDPPRGVLDGLAGATTPPALSFGEAARELLRRRSFVFNTVGQTIYTFAMGGLAAWMPTYFIRDRHVSAPVAATVFGGVLCAAGFIGTLAGGKLGDLFAARRRDGHFLLSGVSLCASLPFTLLAVLASSPAIFWPAMFLTLTLLFLNLGPLNAAMANVLPANLRSRGVGANTFSIHIFGDAPSPWLIGLASDHIGLRIPVIAMGGLLVVGGLVLLAGRAALVRDLEAAQVAQA